MRLHGFWGWMAETSEGPALISTYPVFLSPKWTCTVSTVALAKAACLVTDGYRNDMLEPGGCGQRTARRAWCKLPGLPDETKKCGLNWKSIGTVPTNFCWRREQSRQLLNERTINCDEQVAVRWEHAMRFWDGHLCNAHCIISAPPQRQPCRQANGSALQQCPHVRAPAK